jgi:hypothetical protein
MPGKEALEEVSGHGEIRFDAALLKAYLFTILSNILC